MKSVTYGAYELKKSYQANFTKGLLLAAGVHLALLGTVMIYNYMTAIDPSSIPTITIRTIQDLLPPPSIQAKAPQVQVEAPKIIPPTVGIPKPVPDEMVTEEVVIATRQQMATMLNPAVGSGGEGAALIIDIPDEDFLPGMGDFIAVEKNPVPIKKVDPVYPAMALSTGLSGTVVLRILVYKDGSVKDVQVVKSSGSSVGFEEAAVKAVSQWVFKPAIQNQKPISVWMNWPVVFDITN